MVDEPLVEYDEKDFRHHYDALRLRSAMDAVQKFRSMGWSLIAIELTCGAVQYVSPGTILLTVVAVGFPFAFFYWRGLKELDGAFKQIGKWRCTWRYEPKP